MISLVKHKDIDMGAWDHCLDSSINNRIYAYSWYLNAVCEQWNALIEDDYRSIMPLPLRKKWGVTYVFPPVMTQQLGIFSKEETTESKVKMFLKAIPSSIKYGEIKFNSGNPFQIEKRNIISHNNYELDLSKPYTDLYKAYGTNHQRNVKKISENDITFKKSHHLNPLITLFQQGRGAQLKNLPDDFFMYLRKLFTTLVLMRKVEIYEVYHEENYCGGCLLAIDYARIYFLFSAINVEGKEFGLMHKLIDHIIQTYSSSDTIFDFEGSDNANLARFYGGFGASLTYYQELRINKLPKLITGIGNILLRK